MYQNGMEPEFIRDDISLEPEMPANETEPLLGKYHEKNGDDVFEIVIRNGRLVVDAGKVAFTFLPPDKNGMWALRANPDRMQIRFKRDEQNQVKSFTRFQCDRETEMLRVGALADAQTSDMQELIA